MCRVFAVPTERVGSILRDLSLQWAEGQGLGPVLFRRLGKVLIQVPGRYRSAPSRRLPPVSVAGWKKGNLSILYHGHGTGVEGGRKLSFQRSPSDSCGNFGAQTGALAAPRGSRARRSPGVGNPGNPALGRTRRLGPRDAAHCDS